jgi:nitrogen fixation NifU-like protein
MTDGCGATIACGSMLTSMIKGKSLDEAEAITEDDLIAALGGLPEENLHCAHLAIITLRDALKMLK